MIGIIASIPAHRWTLCSLVWQSPENRPVNLMSMPPVFRHSVLSLPINAASILMVSVLMMKWICI
ncbi:hypothetical protein ACVXHA_18140 [Escherichia coli]